MIFKCISIRMNQSSRVLLIKLSSILTYLIPLALLTGPAVPDILISITSMIFLFLTLVHKEYFYFKNNFFYLFIIFYLYLLLTSLFSENIYHSLSSSLFYFRFILFSLSIWFLINNNKNFIKLFSIIMFITFIFALLDGYSQYILNHNFFGFDKPGKRLFLTFDDRLILGGYLSRLFPLLIAFIFLGNIKAKYKITLLFILLVSTDFLIFVSGERTAFGLLTLMTILIILLIKTHRKIRLISFTISLIIIFFIILNDDDVKYKMIDHTIDQMTSTAIDSEEKSSLFVIFSNEHHSYIMTGVNMFLAKPTIGHGPNSFRNNCNKSEYKYNNFGCQTHPHNTYIQILAEIGIIGLFLISIVVIYLSSIVIKINLYTFGYNTDTNKYSDYQICLIICFIISLWPFFPTQNFFNNWINIIYYLPLGFYLHEIYKNKIYYKN